MEFEANESETVEHKQSLSDWRDIVETVAAFATAKGGTVWVGIAPDGGTVGVQIGRVTLEHLANQIRENTEPSQYPSLTKEGDESAAVIALRVEESPVKPVWAFGRPLKRVGRTNQRLSPDETRRLMDATTGRTWDGLACPGIRADEIDPAAMADFSRRALQETRVPFETALRSLNLMTPEGICNGAVLLFGRNPQQYSPQALVKCGRFSGPQAIDFLDQQTLEGTLLSQVDQALAFVERNTRQGIRITGRPEREAVPEYPPEAVREAVINAVCHRDYTATGNVQVRIYDDRLEVWNPGGLPPDLPIESLYAEHPSRPRNPRLAAALYRARLIEQWGTGTLRILRACRDAGLSRPDFVSQMGTFIVRFARQTSRISEQGLLTLGERRHRVVAHVRRHGRITRREYQGLCRLGERQAREDLGAMVAEGTLARGEGGGAKTYYVLGRTPPQQS